MNARLTGDLDSGEGHRRQWEIELCIYLHIGNTTFKTRPAPRFNPLFLKLLVARSCLRQRTNLDPTGVRCRYRIHIRDSEVSG